MKGTLHIVPIILIIISFGLGRVDRLCWSKKSKNKQTNKNRYLMGDALSYAYGYRT